MEAGERREQLLGAALRAFCRRGYHGAQVQDILDEAGIARGTFYLHFDSKQDVFAELIDRMFRLLMEVAPEGGPADFATAEAWESFLKRSYTGVFSTVRANRQLAHLLLHEAVGIDKGFASKLDRYFDDWKRRIQEMLQDLRTAGLARPGLDLEVASDLILGMAERVIRTRILAVRDPDIPRLVGILVAFERRAVAGRD